MGKFRTAHETEKKVLDYINRKTAKGHTSAFNPLDLSKERIADKLSLEDEEVEEAIESLSGRKDSLERVASIRPKFEIWLPNTKGGKQIKDNLCESGLAISGSLNVLYSFLFLVLCYVLIFMVPYSKSFFINFKSAQDYFVLALLLTAVSVPLGNYLAHKWYQVTILLQKVKGINYYVYVLMGFIVLIIFSLNKRWDIGAIISGIGAFANVALVIYQIAKNNDEKNK